MAWEKVEIRFKKTIYLGHSQGNMYSIPYSSGLSLNDKFEVNGKMRQITSIVNVADRNEVLLMDTMEVQNDKSKARGTEIDDRDGDVPS